MQPVYAGVAGVREKATPAGLFKNNDLRGDLRQDGEVLRYPDT